MVGENIEIKNKELINLLKSNQIFDSVKLYGTLSPLEVHKLFAISDISLLFSKFGESFQCDSRINALWNYTNSNRCW